MSLFPYLFIGVGGTGGKTVGMIHHNLGQTLKRLGIEGMPKGWQFLHIDVTAQVDARSQSLVYDLPASSYVPLTTTQSTYVGLDSSISKTLAATGLARYQAWESWRPVPPTAVDVEVSIGAGQFRAAGRVAVQAALDDVVNAVTRALSDLRDPGVQGEFDAVERAMGGRPDATPRTPGVIVFGSVAGGSGSGMLLDVCDVVRGAGIKPDAVIFTPEVFLHADGSIDPGVAPNTFMAMNELANAMWTVTSQHSTVGRDHLLQRGGARRPSPSERGGPNTVYLVGRSGEGVTLSDTDEVYAVVGRSFAEVALSVSLSNELRAYGAANADARAQGQPDELRLSVPGSKDLGTFGALGFGRVTLGREFFERYASQRLMRLACLRLLDQHLTRHFKGDGKTDDQVLAEATDEAWPGFLAATGLSEVGPRNNEVKNAVDPLGDLAGALAAFEEHVRSETASLAGAKDKVQTVAARAQAVDLVGQHLGMDDPATLHAQAMVAVRRRVDAWARTASDSVRTAVVNAAAEYGLPVTRRLLDKLADDLAQAAREVGGKELDDKRATAQYMLQYLGTGEPGEERQYRRDDAWLGKLASEARQTVVANIEGWTLEHVALVVADVNTNLVQPWRDAVADADATLRRQVRPEQGIKPLDAWPREQGVPTHLRPSRIEYLLDDLDAFPQTFLGVVGQSAGDGVDVSGGEGLDNAVDEVVKQVITARRLRPTLRDDATLRPATYTTLWGPRHGTGRRPASRAAVKLALHLTDLERRVHGWLHDDTKLVGRHLDETLADHVAGSGLAESEKLQRHDRLVAQFAAALKVSKPLVKLDPAMVQEIHPNIDLGAPPTSLTLSPLNVPGSEDKLQQRLLDAAVLAYGQLASLQFTDTPASDATAFSTYATPYHALEVHSLMRPVAAQYAALGGMVDFWKLRRARPLTEWVPLGPDATQALVTGWYVGRVLGRCRVVGKYPPRHEVHVEARHQTPSQWHTLRPTGVRTPTQLNQVGILLELLALSFLDCVQTNSLEPLAPFQELIRLGSAVGSTTVPDPIGRWVESGAGVVDAASSYFPTLPATPEARSEALKARCARLQADYEAQVTPDRLAQVAESQASLMPEVFELLVRALSAISRAAASDESTIDQ